jgi:hypothetical protein
VLFGHGVWEIVENLHLFSCIRLATAISQSLAGQSLSACPTVRWLALVAGRSLRVFILICTWQYTFPL